MPSSLIIGALGLEAGGLAAGLVTLGVRLAEVYAISSLVNRNQDSSASTTSGGSSGGSVQLPPATNNKLPVVYGNQFVSPVIVDALLSTDQQTMWYVLAFSEATDAGEITFGDVYWDDKLLVFDPANPQTISCWYVPATSGGAEANARITGVAGKIGMWFYSNGSFNETTHRCIDTFGTNAVSQEKSNIDAISVLNDGGIPAEIRWTAQNLMSNTVFAICGVQYDSNHSITTLGQIKAEIQNTLGTGRNAANELVPDLGPGSVIKDYLTNSRYGAGIPVANVNTDSLTALDTFSNQQHFLYLTDNSTSSGSKYTINGIIDTTRDCMVNLNSLADCCDSWIQWDERNARWGVVMNRSHAEAGYTDPNTLFQVNKDNIIGGINLMPTDLKASANKLTIQYPNFVLQNQTDYRYYEFPSELTNPNEPENTLTVNFPFVDNDLQATWLGYKKLWTTREDMVISFTMDYSGIKIDAGDIIVINHDWYGWTEFDSVGNPKFPIDNTHHYKGRPFRVTQVKEAKDPSGFLSVMISAMAYNNDIYTEDNPGFFTLTEFNNSNLTDPNIIGPTGKPVVIANTTTGKIVVSSTVPTTGLVDGMEFWYSNTPNPSVNNYALYETQHYMTTSTNGTVVGIYPHSGEEKINVVGVPTGTYYFITRAIGPGGASDFSEASDPVAWTFYNQGIVNGQTIADNSISGTKVMSGDAATNPQQQPSQSKGFFDTLGPTLLGGLAAAALYGGWKNGYLNDILPKDLLPSGGGNDAGQTEISPTVVTMDNQGEVWSDIRQPQEGDEVTYHMDATPPQPEPEVTAYNEGFSDYGYTDWDSGGGGFEWC